MLLEWPEFVFSPWTFIYVSWGNDAVSIKYYSDGHCWDILKLKIQKDKYLKLKKICQILWGILVDGLGHNLFEEEYQELWNTMNNQLEDLSGMKKET